MAIINSDLNSGTIMSSKSLMIWRIVQAAVWLVGAVILFFLLVYPPIGTVLLWNVLITAAPLLFVIAAGLWRNVCPIASTISLSGTVISSKKKRLSTSQIGKLNLVALIVLIILVPLRHTIFNTNGQAAAILIIALVLLSIIVGSVYEWKSAWCSGLCPVYPVEKLYGQNVMVSVPNAFCSQCNNCVIPCPDSVPNISPKNSAPGVYNKIAELLLIGGLPGFIWGWFHVPDEHGAVTLDSILKVYPYPLAGLTVTLVLYVLLSKIISPKFEHRLISIFAAAGVSFYYWYRIPALTGFGIFGPDGALVNLNGFVPHWSIFAVTIMATCFFFYWLVVRDRNNKSWSVRPPYVHA
jgi:hypothetical protein